MEFSTKTVTQTFQNLGFQVPHPESFPGCHAQTYLRRKNQTDVQLIQSNVDRIYIQAAIELCALLFFAIDQPVTWANVADPQLDPRCEKPFYQTLTQPMLLLESCYPDLLHELLFGFDIRQKNWFNWGLLAFDFDRARAILRSSPRPVVQSNLTELYLSFRDSVEVDLEYALSSSVDLAQPIQLATIAPKLSTSVQCSLYCYDGWHRMTRQWHIEQRVCLPSQILTLAETEQIMLSAHLRPFWQTADRSAEFNAVT